ncbi:MAG: Glutamate-tRNA ligase [Candidatus Nomurabacteria bacterium GW2011_GWB1_37_5]|uniref:Glutamate--tRNA ligase n=1 Tax=Candidatus Nomurabacteria bacterium GW2011_GWB1_37_5 TaxID=1618742 RepID=A0A0G0GYZ6_9BACT|nr:MAG: Glutamate-tRNA ligase [Candidatus Nomurabacteria bacterium GW2011_GWB1_37_5]
MNTNNKQVITRFAPSPTGYLHLGAYRTAIYAYLFARKNNGSFVLRIEDTDKERSKKEYEDDIIESLKWLGLDYDKFYRQSEHLDSHNKYLIKMIEDGSAYISKEEAKDGSGVIKEIIRFKNPNIIVKFHDEIKGEVAMNTTDLGDFVIAKNLEEPLFHLAVVVDDFEAGVTHVIRGEDHVSNTPRQILIQRAIGAPTPIYAHLPLVLGPDKLKLSKRRGALKVLAYRDMGFLPEAILNGTAFVGWNPGTDQEVFTRDELIKDFDLSRVQKSPAVFNEEKLNWFNKEHMKLLPMEIIKNEIGKRIINYQLSISNEQLLKLTPIIFDRISKWGDVDEMIKSGELDWVYKDPSYSKDDLIWKKLKDNPEKYQITQSYLVEVEKRFESVSEADFSEESAKKAIWDFAEEKGRGDVLWPLRYALSGREKSPDPFILVDVLGKNETLKRIKNAIKILT